MCGKEIGLEITFSGEGANEKGFLTAVDEQLFIKNVGEKYLAPIKNKLLNSNYLESDREKALVAVDPSYFRPTEVELLIGDPSKAKRQLGWKPQYDLKGLISDMMQSDIKLVRKDAWLNEGGYRTLNYFE